MLGTLSSFSLYTAPSPSLFVSPLSITIFSSPNLPTFLLFEAGKLLLLGVFKRHRSEEKHNSFRRTCWFLCVKHTIHRTLLSSTISYFLIIFPSVTFWSTTKHHPYLCIPCQISWLPKYIFYSVSCYPLCSASVCVSQPHPQSNRQ